MNHNISHLFEVVERLKFPVYFSVDEYIMHPDPNFIMLQLYYYFCEFKDCPKTTESTKILKFKEDMLEKIPSKSTSITKASRNYYNKER